MIKLQFHQEEYSSFLYEEGSVFFPLLEAEEISTLRALFFKHHPKDPQGFYATTHLENKELRKQISDLIYEVIAPKLGEHFSNIEVLGGAFISKAPGEKGILPLHQDWNIVDEEKARSGDFDPADWEPVLCLHDRICSIGSVDFNMQGGGRLAWVINKVAAVFKGLLRDYVVKAILTIITNRSGW